MTIRQAMLLAADRIERSPSCYNFYNSRSPGHRGDGCIIGWTAYYMGEAPGQECGVDGDSDSLCHKLFGIQPDVFFNRIHDLNKKTFSEPRFVAQAMRLYADKYHPDEPIGIPDAVRNIFTLTNEQLREALDA
jgi:hypothetical protein